MKKLNQSGIAHWIVPVLVVLIIAAVGTRILTTSHADPINPSAALSYAGKAKQDLTLSQTLNIPGSQISDLALNPELNVAYTTNDFKISVWSTSSGTIPKLVTTVPSSASKIVVSNDGNYLYSINGNVLAIYQTSTSSTSPLTYLSSSLINGSQPDYLKVSGNYAYVVDWASVTSKPKVEIYDISNKQAPNEVAALGVNSDLLKSPTAIAVRGEYAYVTSDANTTLNVFNISKKTNPVYISSVKLTPGLYNNAAGLIAFKDTYAYVTGINSNVINIVNIANPSAPTLSSTITPPSQNTAYGDDPYNLLVTNDKLVFYTINGGNYLALSYNLTSPATPTYDQTVSLNGNNPAAIASASGYLYVATNISNGPSAGTVYIYKIN